ncbi:MAG: hypothetical protein PWQ75_2293 [Methanolobus sp.]|jgi:hypothetical protein|nr:hypothetical protein [Methanolobus sp.]MDK2832541.1 hypothetical protein [Methanolobus sp.]
MTKKIMHACFLIYLIHSNNNFTTAIIPKTITTNTTRRYKKLNARWKKAPMKLRIAFVRAKAAKITTITRIISLTSNDKHLHFKSYFFCVSFF